MRSTFRFRSVILLAAWLLAAIVAALYLHLRHPEGFLKWLLWLVAVHPLFLLLSAIGELVGAAYLRSPGIKQASEFVERRTKGIQTSGLRILWYLFVTLFALGVVVGGTWLIRHSP